MASEDIFGWSKAYERKAERTYLRGIKISLDWNSSILLLLMRRYSHSGEQGTIEGLLSSSSFSGICFLMSRIWKHWDSLQYLSLLLYWSGLSIERVQFVPQVFIVVETTFIVNESMQAPTVYMKSNHLLWLKFCILVVDI